MRITYPVVVSGVDEIITGTSNKVGIEEAQVKSIGRIMGSWVCGNGSQP